MKFLKHSKRGIGEHSNMMLEEVEEKLDERTGYGELRHADFNFANSEPVVTKVQKKFYVKTKAGKIVSTHSNALDAVKARAKIGDHTTHSIVKEEVESLDEAHKLNDEVVISYPSLRGVKGRIGEIRHGAYKGAPKTYTVDYQHPKHTEGHISSIQLSSDQFKAHKPGKLGEEVESLDEAFKMPERATWEKVNAHSNRTIKAEKLAKTDPTPENKQSAKDHRAHLNKLEALRNKQLKNGTLKTGYSVMHGGNISEDTLDEVVKTEKPRHKVGDTVYATSPTDKALTMTGKVTKIGHTLTTVKHKNGTEAYYPHKLVSKEYSDLHTDSAKKYKQFQREHLEQTGELLTLTEVKYVVENISGGAGAIGQHAGINGTAPQGTGKVKKMMGNKVDASSIAKIIVNGAKTKESN